MRSTTRSDIHSDFGFLPFHRAYIQRLEDDLVLSGNPQFVPLQQWNTSFPINSAFRVFDPSCPQANCMGVSTACNRTNVNWNPSIFKPFYLNLSPTNGKAQNKFVKQ